MADATQIIKLLMEVKTDVADLTGKLTPALGDLRAKIEDTNKSAFGMKEAFEFSGANELVHRLVESIKEIPAHLYEAIKQGVEFNAELQKVQTALAGLFRQEAPDTFKTFESAKVAAGETIELLKDKANELGILYKDMFDSFEHSQAQMAAGGVTNVQKQIDLIALLSRAMQSLGVNATMAARDIGDILQGQAARTLGGGRLAAAMGMTKEELDQWIIGLKETGTLAEGLQSKLGGIGASMGASGQTFNAQVNRMGNALFDLKATAAGPIMEPLTQAIEALTAAMKGAASGELANSIGTNIRNFAAATLIAAGGWAQIAKWIRDVDTTLIHILPGARAFAALMNLGGPASKPGDAEGLDGLMRNLLGLHEKITGEVGKQNVQIELGIQKHGLSKKTLEEIKKIQDDIALKHAEASDDGEAIAQGHAKVAYDETLKAATEKLIPQKEAIKLAEQERDATLEVWRHRAAMKGAHEAHRDIQKQITEFTREEAALIASIHQQQQIVQQNPFASVDQKNAQMVPQITREIAALNAEIVKGKALMAGTALDREQWLRVDAEVKKAETDVTLLGFKLSTLKTPMQGLRAELVSWVNSFGSTVHQVASLITGTLNTAIASTSQAITGLIFGTKNWQQAFLQAAQSIVQNIIQMGLQWLVNQAILLAAGAAGKVAAAATTEAVAAATTAAWAPAATAASIATEGEADIAGIAALTSAMISGIAIVTGSGALGGAGAKEGWYVDRGSHSTADDVPVRVSKGEGIINAREVARRGGRAWVDTINSGVSRQTYVSGGIIGGSGVGGASRTGTGTGGKGDVHIAFFDDRQSLAEWLRSREGQKIVVDTVSGNRINLGLR